MNFEREIHQSFNQSFVQSIPSPLEERTFDEHKLIQRIRYHWNKNQLILRRTDDDCNTYYLGRYNEFHLRPPPP